MKSQPTTTLDYRSKVASLSMASRKRSGSGSKRPKEKVVYIYELLFIGEDPVKSNVEFWNEFFLLPPNVDSLDGEISKLTSEQIVAVKDNINLLFTQCIHMLDSGWRLFCCCFHLNQQVKYFCSFAPQNIRNVWQIVCKHCAAYSTAYLRNSLPIQDSMSSIQYLISKKLKTK